MRLKVMIITAALIVALVSGTGALSMPSLLGKPIMPQMFQQSAWHAPAQPPTPEDVKARSAGEAFTVRVSGNVYFDKLPVQGAEVTIYLNGDKVGQTTAGDIYMFEVPGVRVGDTIRVDATYDGFTGTASEVVRFKSMSLNVNINSGRSFIRNALEMLPSQEDLKEAEKQKQQAAQQPASQQASQPAGSSTMTTSSADAEQLTSQIFSDTAKQLGTTASQSSNAVLNPAAATLPANAGGGITLSDIQEMIKAEGPSGLGF